MFLASIGKPYIGPHKQIHWLIATYVLDVSDEEQARTVVREICGDKDPEVVRALRSDRREEGEYFDIALHQVPSGTIAVYIPEPNSGLPSPYISFRI